MFEREVRTAEPDVSQQPGSSRLGACYSILAYSHRISAATWHTLLIDQMRSAEQGAGMGMLDTVRHVKFSSINSVHGQKLIIWFNAPD